MWDFCSLFFLGEILIFFEILLGDFVRGDAVFRDFGIGGPSEGVEDDFAEVVVGPIFVEVAAGEAEAAASTGAFVGPGDVLGFSGGNGFADVGVSGVGAVFSAHRFLRRMGGEDGGDAFHVGDETHVEIPFVADRKGLHAAGDGVIGEGFELGIPVRVDGVVWLKIAAHPLEKLVAVFALGGFDAVVETGEAAAFFQGDVESFEVVVGHVAFAAIAIENDGVGVFDGGDVGRPVLGELDFGVDAVGGVFVELIGEEEGAGAMLVGTVAV